MPLFLLLLSDPTPWSKSVKGPLAKQEQMIFKRKEISFPNAVFIGSGDLHVKRKEGRQLLMAMEGHTICCMWQIYWRPFLPAAHLLIQNYGPNEEGTVESTASLQNILLLLQLI